MSKITRIHGTSSQITFECEDARIKASGEFLAKDGEIAGFVVSKASLAYEDGTHLTPTEQEELTRRYREYASQHQTQKRWALEFD